MKGGVYRELQAGEEGQATVETALLLVALFLSGYGLMRFLPDLLEAWDAYLGGFYLVLSLPFL